MIWVAVGAASLAASHMVVFPGAMHGFLTYTNEVQRIRAGGGGTSTVGTEAPTKDQLLQGAQGGGAADFEQQLAMQKSGTAPAPNPRDSSKPSKSQPSGGIKTRPHEASEREALARLRSEREREHIKLLCDLAGNKDLGDEVTDAAKQLVLEFLRRPLDDEIDLDALRKSIA